LQAWYCLLFACLDRTLNPRPQTSNPKPEPGSAKATRSAWDALSSLALIAQPPIPRVGSPSPTCTFPPTVGDELVPALKTLIDKGISNLTPSQVSCICNLLHAPFFTSQILHPTLQNPNSKPYISDPSTWISDACDTPFHASKRPECSP
jgi:hypothetical protein